MTTNPTTALYHFSKEGNLEALKNWVADNSVQPYWLARAIEYAAYAGKSEVLPFLMETLRKESFYDLTCALELGAEQGHLECVKLLLPQSTPQLRKSQAFRHGALHADMIDLLLPYSDLEANENEAVLYAVLLCVSHNRLDNIQKLMPHWTHKHLDHHQLPLTHAASLGHRKIVAYLLDHLDASLNQSAPLKAALGNRDMETSLLLIPQSVEEHVLPAFEGEPGPYAWIQKQFLLVRTQPTSQHRSLRRL